MFSVKPDEIEVVSLIPMPPHPGVEFDENELRSLIAGSCSFTLVQKVRLILAAGTLTQEKCDRLLEILREDRAKYAEINERHNERLRKMEERFAAAAKQLEEAAELDQSAEVAQSTKELSPAERAIVIRKSIDDLLQPLGDGEAKAFLSAFLQRLVWIVGVEGGDCVVEDDLPSIFAPELRNEKLNRSANDPAADMTVINKLVRPALSRLRRMAAPAPARHKGSIFGASWVIEGPDRPKGPKRQRHRVGVLIRLHAVETRRYAFWRTFIRGLVGKLMANGQEIVPVARFGLWAPVIRRIVETVTYSNDVDRALLELDVAGSILREILPVLPPLARAQFLMYLTELPLRSSEVIPEPFNAWFLTVIDFNDGLSSDDEQYDFNADRFLFRLRYSGFSFETQVFLARVYRMMDGRERFVLTGQLRFFDAGAATNTREAGLLRPPEAVDMERLLSENTSNVADFIKMTEEKVLRRFQEL